MKKIVVMIVTLTFLGNQIAYSKPNKSDVLSKIIQMKMNAVLANASSEKIISLSNELNHQAEAFSQKLSTLSEDDFEHLKKQSIERLKQR